MNSFDILSKKQRLQNRLFLEASAGTGKTFTLEHIVVRILLESDLDLENIVVVTFTRAAARELKTRIRNSLEQLVLGLSSYDYLEGISTEQREKIKTTLLNFDQAQIFTIHGFCQKVLHEFAFEAQLGGELKPWEGEEERVAILNFLRHFDQLSTDRLSTAQMKRVLRSNRQSINLVVEKLRTSSLIPIPPLDFYSILQKLNFVMATIKPFPLVDEFAQIRVRYRGLGSAAFELQAIKMEQFLLKKEVSFQELDRLIEEEEIFLEKIKSSNLKTRAEHQISPHLEKLQEKLLPLLEVARSAQKILDVLKHGWQQHRRAVFHETISPDDLLGLMSRSMGKGPFIQAVQKKYGAVIIDEFQDTDPEQWNIFETLFFHDPKKKFYVVGDPKQSIYSFRRADIYTFFHAVQSFKDTERGVLNVNYRSTPGLLNLLNKLLSSTSWMDLPKLKKQLKVPPLTAAKEGDGTLSLVLAEGSLGRGKRWPNQELEEKFLFPFIVHEIQRLQLEPNQVAVLVKDRHQASRIKEYFNDWGVPSFLYREKGLSGSSMISCIEEVVEAYCTGEIKKVVLGHFIQLSLERVSPEIFSEAKESFVHLFLLWKKRGFFSFFSQFLQTSFYGHTVLEQLTAKGDLTFYEDLMKILEKVAFIQEPHRIMMALKKIKREEVKEKASAHPQGIQIMTVYGSKGLEFETVFALALASRTPVKDEEEACLQERNAEKMRELYVALTRAKSHLYIPILREKTGAIFDSYEASPMEIFLQKASPDLEPFTQIDLNQTVFNLKPYQKNEKGRDLPSLEPRPSFDPIFLHSFSSLRQKDGGSHSLQKRASKEKSFPDGMETGVIIHRILKRFFDERRPFQELILQETRGTLLEGYEEELFTTFEKSLDLMLVPLSGNEAFCLREIDQVIAEMEFVFATQNSYIKGFIDLAIEYQGQYYLIDWKTHVLNDYLPETLEKCMKANDYFLQSRIYATAFQKYLNHYKKASFFGGVFFFFIRGPAVFLL